MEIGGVIGQYRITGLLGQGGMGTVYAAEHNLLGRLAAVKVLLPEYSRDQQIVTRFFNEARAAAAVRHPGIVEIYDFGWHSDGAAYIAMERLEGASLKARSAHERMSWNRILLITRQIAGVLAAAHAKGIVHRDLKPDNVFLVPDPEVPGGERVKLLDFGIAKLMGDPGNQVKTRTGSVMGTPGYMAPEQCRGVAVDHRADLYSLGCILFELCTERVPFVGEGTGDVLAAHIYVPVPMMGSLVPNVPSEVERLVQRLLAKRPEDRVQTADDLIKEIDAVTRSVVYLSGSQPAVSVSSARAASASGVITARPGTTLSGAVGARTLMVRGDRRLRSWGLGAAAALAAAGATIYLAQRDADTTTEVSVAEAVPELTRVPAAREPARPASAQAASTSIPVRSASEPVRPASAQAPSISMPTRPASEPASPASTQAPSTSEPVRSASEPVRSTATLAPAPGPSVSLPAPAAAKPENPVLAAKPPPHTPTPASPTVELVVESTPPGAEVLLSGAVLGKTPFRGALPRGDRDLTIAVRLRGYLDKTVVVRPDNPINQRIKLDVSARPQPARRRDDSVDPFAQ